MRWDSKQQERPSGERARDLVELGVRLGLEAAAKKIESEKAKVERTTDRITLANVRVVVLDIDPAAVLRKEK